MSRSSRRAIRVRDASGKRVAVIGAGLAGLAAAHRLQRAGAQVAVFEAQDRVGGRLRTERLDGFAYEPATQALPESCPDLCSLSAELGASGAWKRTPLERIVERRRRGLGVLSIAGPVSVQGGLWIPGVQSLRARRVRKLIAWLGQTLNTRRPEDDTRIDDRSVTDFAWLYLDMAVNARLYAPLVEHAFGLDALVTSRLLLFQLLDAQGKPRVVQSQGLSFLPERLAGGLAQVRTGTRIDSVTVDGRHIQLATGDRRDVDAVVIATSANEVPKLLPTLTPTEQLLFASSRSVQRCTLAVSLDGNLGLPVPDLWVRTANDAPIEALASVSDLTAALPGSDGTAGKTLVLLRARADFLTKNAEISDAALREELISRANALLPGFRTRIRETALHRDAYATPCFDVGRYRQIERLRNEQNARTDRNLFLAGDYLIAPHLEGAVASGFRAAEQVLDRFTQ